MWFYFKVRGCNFQNISITFSFQPSSIFPFLKPFFATGTNWKICLKKMLRKRKLIWVKHLLFLEVWLKWFSYSVELLKLTIYDQSQAGFVCPFLNWTLLPTREGTGQGEGRGKRLVLCTRAVILPCYLQSNHRDSTASGFVVCMSAVAAWREKISRHLCIWGNVGVC